MRDTILATDMARHAAVLDSVQQVQHDCNSAATVLQHNCNSAATVLQPYLVRADCAESARSRHSNIYLTIFQTPVCRE